MVGRHNLSIHKSLVVYRGCHSNMRGNCLGQSFKSQENTIVSLQRFTEWLITS